MYISRRMVLVTFLESFSTILVERGLYFFCHNRLGFSDALNLWLALGFGATYAVGAVCSHRLSGRTGEKSLLLVTVAGALGLHLLLAAAPTVPAVFAANIAIGVLYGLKWPVVESYFMAGQTPGNTARVVGRFNLSWSVAIPPALAVAGPLIALHDSALFLLAAGLNVATILLILTLPRRPAYLPHDHPERPRPEQLACLRSLMISSRWLLLASYSTMWVLVALVPGIFAGLGCEVSTATTLAGLLDVCRLAAFILLGRFTGWHNRVGPLLLVVVGLPAAFFMVLFGTDLPTVLAGEMLFGLFAGQAYYAALYYAMVVKNASVDAGGGHEGLIGTGFAFGPAAALAGVALAPFLGGRVPGTLAGIGPLLLACAVGAVWQIARLTASAGRPRG